MKTRQNGSLTALNDPEVVQYAIGRPLVNCKCIEILTAEHKTMLRMAEVLDSMSTRAGTEGEYNQEDVETILNILLVFGDKYHQAKEEGALFPVFAAVCDRSEYAAVRHMLFEHQQDRSLIEGMEDAVRRSNAPQFAEYAQRLATILRNHIYKEDNILFEKINATLSQEDDAQVILDFEGFDREFRKHEQEMMHRLRVLEAKYLRKPG
jgi:hemerythrin-like domain-containing protein